MRRFSYETGAIVVSKLLITQLVFPYVLLILFLLGWYHLARVDELNLHVETYVWVSEAILLDGNAFSYIWADGWPLVSVQ